jgi:hypothetical protein
LLLARRLKPKVRSRPISRRKTEIVQRIVLEGDQRDLYETIGLTMHERVRREIAAHSLERSQIIVLDALLKLRQVCCTRAYRSRGNVKGTLGIAGRGGDAGSAGGDERQAGGPDAADAARTRERRPASAGVFAIHLEARFDQARTCYG